MPFKSNLEDDSANDANDFSQGAVFEPQWPPWFQADSAEKKEFAKDSFSLGTVKRIIAEAFRIIEKNFPGYQQRSAQIGMAEQVLHSLLQGHDAVIEAGTGVGKSFAYLVAVLAWSYLRGERVLVVTETKNLQMQLFEKDMPFLVKALDRELSFELALGASNYLCRLRYEDMLNRGNYHDLVDDTTMKQLHLWAESVFKSDKLHGHIYEPGNDFPKALWVLVNREPEGCPASKCGYYLSCNYYRARKDWAKARLIVGNHHLLLFHLLNDKRTLPPLGVLMIDEAHGFIKNGYNIFTLSYSSNSLSEQKKIADRFEKRTGFLPLEKKEELDELWRSAENAWQRFFQSMEIEQNLSFEENKSVVIAATAVSPDNLSELLGGIGSVYTDMLEATEDSMTLNDLRTLVKQLERARVFIRRYEELNTETDVYWAEKRQNLLYLNTCRINIGEEINALMDEQRIYTSATLGYWSKGEFPQKKSELINQGYFRSFCREALGEWDISTLDFNIFFSPFDYRQQALLYIPEGIEAPDFNAPMARQRIYEEKLFAEIAQLTTLSRGGALVLFTSNYLMRLASEALRELTDLRVISQGELGAVDALEEFRSDPNAILLGVNSFWQGVDISGDGLRMLIITKLMFQPPDDPIFKARSEKLAAKGGKPFFELAMPFASAMLRQGFGRLIRSESDRGVVAILDSRLLQKSYGKNLIANLPRCTLVHDFNALKKEVAAKGIFPTI